jgi:hypothetical protein
MIPTKIALVLLLAVQWGHCSIWIIRPSPQPPQPDEVAKMARYIMRNSDWVSVATTSTQKAIQGYPFVSLKSVSDGTASNSTGVPYLYMTDMDVSGKDIEKDNRCTILASLAESEYCKQKNFDPQDPRCAKLIITGKMVKVDKDSSEYEFGQNALFSKHPSMKWWPKGRYLQYWSGLIEFEFFFRSCVLRGQNKHRADRSFGLLRRYQKCVR